MAYQTNFDIDCAFLRLQIALGPTFSRVSVNDILFLLQLEYGVYRSSLIRWKERLEEIKDDRKKLVGYLECEGSRKETRMECSRSIDERFVKKLDGVVTIIRISYGPYFCLFFFFVLLLSFHFFSSLRYYIYNPM